MATSPTFDTSNSYIKYRIVVTETAVSQADNTSTVNIQVQAWRTNNYTTDASGTCYCTTDGIARSDSWSYGQKAISYYSYTVLFERNYILNHDNDGTKTIYVSAYINHSKFSSSSHGFSVTLTPIARKATITSCNDLNDEENFTIYYNNPLGSEATLAWRVCETADWSDNLITSKALNSEADNKTFIPSSSERNRLRRAARYAKHATFYHAIQTIINGVDYYDYHPFTYTVINDTPTIGVCSYEDTNATTLAITSNDQEIIQGLSTVDVTTKSLRAYKEAYLDTLSITINGVTQSVDISGAPLQSTVVTSWGAINSAEDLSATITITDTRGNTATKTLPITMLAWSNPTATISCKRQNNFESNTDLLVNANYSSLNGHNSVTIQYQYKEKSAGAYSSPVTISDGVTAVVNLDNTKEWDLQVIVTDLIGSTTYTLSIGLGLPSLFIDNFRRSVGVGAFPDQNNMFVADRRISLKNLNQETVADLWSATNSGVRTSFLSLYDQDGDTRVTISGGSTNGGTIGVYGANGGDRIVAGAASGGGSVGVYSSSGTLRGRLFSSSDGGQIYLYNPSDVKVAEFGVGTGNKDGIWYVKDHSGNDTAFATGENGKITCISLVQTSSRKVKKNIVSMALDEARKILSLVAVKFDFKDEAKGKNKSGFIAEDVAEVLPDLVSPNKDAIDYIGMIAYLQAVIKDHEERIKALEDKLNGGA